MLDSKSIYEFVINRGKYPDEIGIKIVGEVLEMLDETMRKLKARKKGCYIQSMAAKKYNKPIRDKIPEITGKGGKKAIVKKVEGEYLIKL